MAAPNVQTAFNSSPASDAAIGNVAAVLVPWPNPNLSALFDGERYLALGAHSRREVALLDMAGSDDRIWFFTQYRFLITYEAHVRTCALARDPIQAASMASCNSFGQCWATVTRSRRRKTLG